MQVKIMLVFLLFMTSCAGVQPLPGNPDERDLKNVAAVLRDVAVGVGVFEQIVMDAEAQQTITTDQARPLVEISLKVSQAGKEAVAVTRELNKLDATSRQNILNILVPVIDSVNRGLEQNIVEIKDLKVRTDVRTIFMLIQTSLSTAQLLLVTR